jgi:hypothetical protein
MAANSYNPMNMKVISYSYDARLPLEMGNDRM